MFIEEILMGDRTHNTYINLEQKKLLNYFKFTVKLYEHELNIREQNVARLMVEKSLLLRRTGKNNNIYFTRNSPNA